MTLHGCPHPRPTPRYGRPLQDLCTVDLNQPVAVNACPTSSRYRHPQSRHQDAKIRPHRCRQIYLTVLFVVAARRVSAETRVQHGHLPATPLLHTASFFARITLLEVTAKYEGIGTIVLTMIGHVVGIQGQPGAGKYFRAMLVMVRGE